MRIIARLFVAIIDLVRPFFGFQDVVCIYPVSCIDFAHEQFQKKPLLSAFLHIAVRVISCNPIVAWYRRFHR